MAEDFDNESAGSEEGGREIIDAPSNENVTQADLARSKAIAARTSSSPGTNYSAPGPDATIVTRADDQNAPLEPNHLVPNMPEDLDALDTTITGGHYLIPVGNSRKVFRRVNAHGKDIPDPNAPKSRYAGKQK